MKLDGATAMNINIYTWLQVSVAIEKLKKNSEIFYLGD